MKVCLLFPRFTGPYGAEGLVLNLTKHLAEEDIDITIYTHAFDSRCKKLLSNRVKIVETGFPHVRDHDVATMLDYILMPALAIKVLGDYDLFHAINWQSVLGVYFIRCFHEGYRKVPALYHCTEPPRFIYDLRAITLMDMSPIKRSLTRLVSPIIKILDKSLVKRFDGFVAISDYIKEQLKRIYGVSSVVAYPGINIEQLRRYSRAEARQKLGLDENAKIFLSVCKLHRRKRLDWSLKIYKKYSKNLGDSRFLIIGDGPDEERIKRLVRAWNIEGVEFLGVKRSADIPFYYSAADYFIFAAKDEPFGIAPLEAKYLGCKVLGIENPYPIISWKESARRIIEVYARLAIGNSPLSKR